MSTPWKISREIDVLLDVAPCTEDPVQILPVSKDLFSRALNSLRPIQRFVDDDVPWPNLRWNHELILVLETLQT